MKWNNTLETGIKEIDNQHREIFNRIDALEIAIFNGRGKTELVKIIEFIESYVKEHFDAEEKLLMDNHYPDFTKHYEQHNKFRSLFKELFIDFSRKGPDQYLAMDVDKILRKWWNDHILKMDMDYLPFIKNK